jgi:hypothetical protein
VARRTVQFPGDSWSDIEGLPEQTGRRCIVSSRTCLRSRCQRLLTRSRPTTRCPAPTNFVYLQMASRSGMSWHWTTTEPRSSSYSACASTPSLAAGLETTDKPVASDFGEHTLAGLGADQLAGDRGWRGRRGARLG